MWSANCVGWQALLVELGQHEVQLVQLTSMCERLQDAPDTRHLAPSLLEQLSQVREAFQQLRASVPARLAALQVPPLPCEASAL